MENGGVSSLQVLRKERREVGLPTASGAGRSVSMTNVAGHKIVIDPRVQWHTSLWSCTWSVLLTFWQLILQCSS